jgi:hypothetical protein
LQEEYVRQDSLNDILVRPNPRLFGKSSIGVVEHFEVIQLIGEGKRIFDGGRKGVVVSSYL